jgi:hypothetical protein
MYYFLSLLFYVVVTVSYRCTLVTSAIYCCVISVTVIVSHEILLCLWYLVCHSYMYVAIVSIKMCLSVNDISKCGAEYKITQKVDIILGVIYSICMH